MVYARISRPTCVRDIAPAIKIDISIDIKFDIAISRSLLLIAIVLCMQAGMFWALCIVRCKSTRRPSRYVGSLDLSRSLSISRSHSRSVDLVPNDAVLSRSAAIRAR